MTFDELQASWQSQAVPKTVTIDESMLLTMTRRDQRSFVAGILWRDIRDVSGFLLFGVFFLGIYINSHSIGALTVALGCLFVGGFFIVDRLIQKKPKPVYEESIGACVRQSLHQVNHQIWLLRNVLWWCLLPIGIGIVLGPWLEQGWACFNKGHIFILVIFYGSYRINQHTVLYVLRPRRNELIDLLQQLDPEDSTLEQVTPNLPYSTGKQVVDILIVVLLSGLCLAAIVSIGAGYLSGWSHRQAVDIHEFVPPDPAHGTMAMDPNQANKLVILKARYGYKRAWVDVTEHVRAAVDGNSLIVIGNSGWAGDPCFGKVKSLVVWYVHDGKQGMAQSQEVLALNVEDMPTGSSTPNEARHP